ncbi:hypothetical protein Acr_10g0006980 [Actinidia rufa]|uniref:Uncharacterized protein n=1 Tax=Actinidia rufa TaxID=165716 RepID=A0A7J0F9N2_9ERIC|nr:hypothetical protein Acr_10g0006980 [Actinidia rufa]
MTPERGSFARNWCGQESRFLLSHRDHEEFLLKYWRYFQFLILAELKISFTGATIAAAKKLLVGATEDEEGKGNKVQHKLVSYLFLCDAVGV